jgi:hypothetical protein
MSVRKTPNTFSKPLAVEPEWLETPGEYEYTLLMADAFDTRQQIDLTREEYIALKRHLAEFRRAAAGGR